MITTTEGTQGSNWVVCVRRDAQLLGAGVHESLEVARLVAFSSARQTLKEHA